MKSSINLTRSKNQIWKRSFGNNNSSLFPSSLSKRKDFRSYLSVRSFLTLQNSRFEQKFQLGKQPSFNPLIYSSRQFSIFDDHFPNSYREYDFDTVVQLQEGAVKHFPKNRLFGTRNGDKYDWITYEEFGLKVDQFRKVLHSLGIKKDDKVALISNNRVEWAITSYAAFSLGAQIVPMYEAQLEKDWKFIIENSNSKLLVVASESIFEKVKDYPRNVGNVENVLAFDLKEKNHPNGFQHWMEKVATQPEVPSNPTIVADDLCTIIYTSGTTGVPKGVELTHRNIVSDIKSGKLLWNNELQNMISLAFLPWAHVFGMTTELHSMVSTGSSLAIVPSREQILECLALAKPTIIFSVPVLFNKVYDGVMKNISGSSFFLRLLFHYALGTARQRNHNLEFGIPVSPFLEWRYQFVQKVVFQKIRDRFGGNLKYMASGGASTSLKVLQFFEDINIPIFEGYGLTETAPVITASGRSWSQKRLGCVGVPLSGVDVMIIDPSTMQPLPKDTEGEITVSGPNVMKGYRNNPTANEESFFYYNDKRFFRTGDLGQMVEGRFLKLTGRIKEQYKLENGKFVVPAPVEDLLCLSNFFQQVFVYGDNRPFNIVLVVPNLIEIANWAKGKENFPSNLIPIGVEANDQSISSIPLFENDEFKKLIERELRRTSKRLKSYEKPTLWYPLLHPFSQENQQLTPKMSLRRDNILKAYQPLIDKIYDGELGYPITHKK